MYRTQNPMNQAMYNPYAVDYAPRSAGQYPYRQQTPNINPAQGAMQGYQVYNTFGGGTQAAGTSFGTTTPGVGGVGGGGVSSGGATGAGSAGGAGAMGWIGNLAAAIYADEVLARETAGTWDDPEAAWENNVRGITRYGGIGPGPTAMVENAFGKENMDKIFRVFDPIGATEKIEGPIAEATAATIPKALGGTGHWDPIGSYLLG